MAPMGVGAPIGLTNHGEVEALELLCARCETLEIFNRTEVVLGLTVFFFFPFTRPHPPDPGPGIRVSLPVVETASTTAILLPVGPRHTV